MKINNTFQEAELLYGKNYTKYNQVDWEVAYEYRSGEYYFDYYGISENEDNPGEPSSIFWWGVSKYNQEEDAHRVYKLLRNNASDKPYFYNHKEGTIILQNLNTKSHCNIQLGDAYDTIEKKLQKVGLNMNCQTDLCSPYTVLIGNSQSFDEYIQSSWFRSRYSNAN